MPIGNRRTEQVFNLTIAYWKLFIFCSLKFGAGLFKRTFLPRSFLRSGVFFY